MGSLTASMDLKRYGRLLAKALLNNNLYKL